MSEYVKLAIASIESYVKYKKVLEMPEGLLPELTKEQAGVFVSIHKKGALRGCIGTIGPCTSCVAQEIIENAVSASTRDPRFSPITSSELPDLEVNVDVLGAPEPIDDVGLLDPKVYGVIVERDGRRGLLLPDLEGVDTVEDQLYIARQKAGIPMNLPVNLYRFKVIRHTL